MSYSANGGSSPPGLQPLVTASSGGKRMKTVLDLIGEFSALHDAKVMWGGKLPDEAERRWVSTEMTTNSGGSQTGVPALVAQTVETIDTLRAMAAVIQRRYFMRCFSFCASRSKRLQATPVYMSQAQEVRAGPR